MALSSGRKTVLVTGAAEFLGSHRADPYATFTTSVPGAQRLIEMARGGRCMIVQASTSEATVIRRCTRSRRATGGNVNPIGPTACHDEGQRGAETLLSDARRCWGVDARIVRIFQRLRPAHGDQRRPRGCPTSSCRRSQASR